MKIRFQLACVVFGVVLTISRLAAQDVTVTDPAWFDLQKPPADQPPTFKKRPKPEFPEELKELEQVGYVIVEQMIGANGERLHRVPMCSNPYLEKAIEGEEKFSPAKRDGKTIEVSCWYGIIFNPRSARKAGSDATPRLLGVAPIRVEKKAVPSGIKLPQVIWATVSLNENGALTNFVFDDSAHEAFRQQVGDSLRAWRFAPARREGKNVEAELHLPLVMRIFSNEAKTAGPSSPPKPVYRKQPVYPIAMNKSGLRGQVKVEFIVDKTGAVKNPVIIESNNPGFNEAAIEAVLQWTFKPGIKGGVPVDVRMQLPVVFELTDGGRDLVEVSRPSKKKQQKLPQELQYDTAPKPTGVIYPVYPYPLLRDGTTGKAVVVYVVDAEGRVSNTKLIEATQPEFGQAVIAAVETFHFIPALKDGKPTSALMNMEQIFRDYPDGAIIAEKSLELLKMEKNHPEKILSAKTLDAPLKPVSRHSAVFPSALQGRLNLGEAVIQILIDEEGKVYLPRIVKATDPAFGYAAMQAVVEWRFDPPMAEGKPAVVRVQVPFVFKQGQEGDQPKANPAIDKSTFESALPEEKQP